MTYDLGPEAVLTAWDDTDDPVEETVAMLVRGLTFISNWQRQLKPENFRETLNYDSATVAKVDQTRRKVQAALDAWNKPGLTFPGNSEINLYRQAQLAYPDTWRSVMLSIGSLEQPDFLDTLAEIPKDLGQSLTDIILNFLKGFWPVIVVAVIVILVFIFRKHIFKAR